MLPIVVAVVVAVLSLIAAAVWFFIDRPADIGDETGEEIGLTEDEDGEDGTEDEVDLGDLDEDGEDESLLPTDEGEDLPDGEDDEEEAVVAIDQDRILYIKDDNIWVINPDGTNKIQLTTDGVLGTITYRALAWREPGVISFSRCAGSCKIYTRDLATAVDTEILEGIPFTQSFDAIEWSHDGSTLGYIFTKGDGSKEASLWTVGGTIVLESYAPPPGRGGHYDDGMEMEFSPDDSRVLVLNTIIDTVFNKPVILFQADGTKVVELTDASFPTFDENTGFYYKSTTTGGLMRWVEATAMSSLITSFPTSSIHDLHASPDGYFVLFWSDVGGADPTQAYYDTGGSPSAIAADYLGGKWIDDSSVYVVAQEVSGISEAGFFEIGGISRVKRTDGTTTALDTGWISMYEVE